MKWINKGEIRKSKTRVNSLKKIKNKKTNGSP